jgi:hypothetical protein
MELGELIKLAYSGPSAYIFGFLNIIAVFTHRMAFVSTRWAFTMAGILGGFFGAFNAFIQAQAEAGVSPAILMNAVMVGLVVGVASSLLIGWGISAGADKIGMWQVSDAKKVSEEVRDPLSPTQPAGVDIRTDTEKPAPSTPSQLSTDPKVV